MTGIAHATDMYCRADNDVSDWLKKYRIPGIDTETASLYTKAAKTGANALATMTLSDHLRTRAALTAQQSQSSFDAMIRLALDTFCPGINGG